MKLLTYLMAACLCAHAQLLTLDLTVSGMDCVSCVTGLETKLKRMRGVETVAINTATGTVSLKLAASNTIRIDRIRDEIKGVGFTPKEARIKAVGKTFRDGDSLLFVLEATNQRFQITKGAEKLAAKQDSQLSIEAMQSPGATPQQLPTLQILEAHSQP